MAKKVAAKKVAAKKAAAKVPSPSPAPTSADQVTHVDVRMYRLGTGDCFVLKFGSARGHVSTIMIDCGVWTNSKAKLTPYIKDLKSYVGDRIDVLIITHEHLDHVSVFDTCEELFTDGKFQVGETWMAWCEEDGKKEIQRWKDDHGQRAAKALAIASAKLTENCDSAAEKELAKTSANGFGVLAARQVFAAALNGFATLHMAADGAGYVGPLKGMTVVKSKIARDPQGESNIRYWKPGDVILRPSILPGVKVYVLGPPADFLAVKEETSTADGEAYDHNRDIARSTAFVAAVENLGMSAKSDSVLPFDPAFALEDKNGLQASLPATSYQDPASAWRRIDNDWLSSAGSLALRMNSRTNNLSLALAFEFENSKRVMLFPGDAEYGSWASWHQIDWSASGVEPAAGGETNKKHFTEDLLNRTVFYKVAHHLSHNGTAQRLGLEMMKHKDLAAMATLDYDNIASHWKSTMPNGDICSELLQRCKGRLMVMRLRDDVLLTERNRERLAPLSKKIHEARRAMSPAEAAAFSAAHTAPTASDLYVEYRVTG